MKKDDPYDPPALPPPLRAEESASNPKSNKDRMRSTMIHFESLLKPRRTLIQCCLCGTSQRQDLNLVIGPAGAICEPCIQRSFDAIHSAKNEGDGKTEFQTPASLKAILDQSIIGQDDAKVTLAVAVYNHYKRLRLPPENGRIAKSNILLVGPSGTGKTLLAETLAKAAQVPFVTADATTLTARGYVGDDVESILLRLLAEANYDVSAAERGIVYIDEIDKLARKTAGRSATRDVNGESVQHALLKKLEGSTVTIGAAGQSPTDEPIRIDTTNILFICGGAFEGIEDIMNRRCDSPAIGFGAPINRPTTSRSTSYSQITPDDLVGYGLMPELVGRLPIIAALEPLNERDLIDVLTKPKNAVIGQFKTLLEIDNVQLEFTDAALREIAREAITSKTGARGLRAILERSLLQTMFDAPSDHHHRTVTIDAIVVAKSQSDK